MNIDEPCPASEGEARPRERGMSKDRRPPTRDENQPPPILPELQHLAMPPPPPPPPQHPMPGDQSQGLKLQTAFTPPVNQYNASAVPLPQSGMASEPPSATAQFQGHRRGRSGNESTGMFGGLRNLADRMRSTAVAGTPVPRPQRILYRLREHSLAAELPPASRADSQSHNSGGGDCSYVSV